MSVAHAMLDRLKRELPLACSPWEHPLAGRLEAAVLVALSLEAAPRVLLGRRAMHLPLHPGEVAFPGGKRELEDATPWVTALREAHEEVGIQPEDVHPLGELSVLVTRTGFEVYPCIARIPTGLDLVVDPAEFDSVFTLPLEIFAERQRFRLEVMSDGNRARKVPHYQVDGDNIWGVTAAVLAQLANVAYDAGLDLQRNWTTTP